MLFKVVLKVFSCFTQEAAFAKPNQSSNILVTSILQEFLTLFSSKLLKELMTF